MKEGLAGEIRKMRSREEGEVGEWGRVRRHGCCRY